MSRIGTLVDRLEHIMLRHSLRVLPSSREEWGRAMLAEARHIEGRSQRVMWAAGCLIAAYKERSAHMCEVNVSRGVLAMEWIFCFGFLSLWGIVEILDIPGLASGNLEQLAAYLSQRGPAAAVAGGLELLVSMLGPIGLLLALRYISSGRGLRNRTFATAAISTLLLSGALVMGLHAWQGSTVGFDWRGLTLLALLPAFGYWHLDQVSRSDDGRRVSPT